MNLFFVPHNFKDNALTTGTVDAMSAYLSNQPFYYKQKGIKINIINPTSYGIDFYGDMLITSKSYFNKNKKTALAFRRATLRGWEYALANPHEAIEWIQKIYGSKKSKEALNYEANITKQMVANKHIKLGKVSPKRLDYIATIYKKNDKSLKNNSIKGLYYKDLIRSEADYKKIVFVIVLIVIVLGLAITLLILFNRKLKKNVELRTKEIEEAYKKLDQYFSIINDNVILLQLNKEGIILNSSTAYNLILSGKSHKTVGGSIFSNKKIIFNDLQYKKLKKALKENTTYKGECLFITKENNKLHIEFTYYPTSSELTNSLNENVIIFSDITEKKYIENLSQTDHLTQLANRYALNKLLAVTINETNPDTQSFCVIMLDIDHFKQVNDQLGHQAGDDVLKNVGNLLKEMTSPSLIPDRWGGEEFLILCKNTPSEKAETIADNIRLQLHDINIDNGRRITCSLGVAQLNKNESIENLIKRADVALYEAKESGRNQVKVSNS